MSSLIEYDAPGPIDPNLRSPYDRNVPGDPNQGDMQTNLLELAWQARWLILLLVLVGIGSAWVVLQRVEPRYTSLSRLYIERNLPRLLSDEMMMSMGNSTSYLYTQAELIMSTPVLAAAADAPENAALETFREVDSRVGFLRDELEVNVGQNDEIINVSLELPKPEEAAQLVNSVVDAYIAKYAEKNRTDTVEILNILRSEKERRDAELKEREEALEEFRRQNAALAVKVGEENVISQQFAKIATELGNVDLEYLDAKARYNRTQEMFKTPEMRPFLLELASQQQQVASDLRFESQLQLDLEKQAQEVELQIATLQAALGNGHPKVKVMLDQHQKILNRLAEQHAKVEEQKATIVSAYVETIAQDFRLLETKRSELQRKYDAQFKLAMQANSQSIKLAALEDSLERTVRLVEILDERIKEVNLTEDVGAMNVSILEVAAPSPLPSYPSRVRFLAVGALLGGMVGFGLAWLRDMMDHRLKSIDEIAATLQLPVLGALPLSNSREKRNVTGKIILTQPRSIAAEAFRTLRTAIHFGLTRDDARILCITSPSPGDGKSTMASNLALAMAQADQRILLIDADMRKPTQHEIFEATVERGLSSVLTERRPAEELIVSTPCKTLDLLPCGIRPANPVELLNNGFFSELLQELLSKYDKIVIDAPPIMPVADARVIAAQTDATILVLRADRSTRRLSIAARDELWKVRAQRIGVVVNAVPGRKQSSYDSGYGYGYGDYGYVYGNYGDTAYGEDEPLNGASRKKKSRVVTSNSDPVPELQPASQNGGTQE